MKSLFIIALLATALSAQAQTIKGIVTQVQGDTVTVNGQKFIIKPELCVGDSITLTVTNISNRFTRRKRNAKKVETETIGASEFVKQ